MDNEKQEKILKLFDSRITGLNNSEIEERIEKYGKNILPETKQESLFITFLKQFRDPLIYILLFGSVVSFLLKEFSDAIFILIILSLNSLIGGLQELSAKKSANSLKSMIKAKNIVVRNGREIEIDAEDITVGDIVMLSEGTKIPADMILLYDNNFFVNESMLTGETESIRKKSDYIQKENCQLQEKFNEIFSGTIVVKGNAIAVVKSIGANTEIGKIAEKITEDTEVKTPLVIRIEAFSKAFTYIIGISVILIVIINILNGSDIRETFLMAVSLAVAAIPEGLPITITIALSIGMAKMAKKNVIIRNLSAVEALGSCTVIASDKTGTLTQNKMTIKEVFSNEYKYLPVEKTDKKIDLKMEDFDKMNNEQLGFLTAILANEGGYDGKKYFGDAVDVAFLNYASNRGCDVEQVRKNFPLIKKLHYSSENRCGAGFVEINNKIYVFVKGATETILTMCENKEKMCKNVDYREVIKEMNRMSECGMRVLAMCYGEVDKVDWNNFNISYLTDLKFLSMVSMLDPLREESLSAVNTCQTAGINILMITGDNPKTAFAIGRDLGFVDNQNQVKTGEDVKNALNIGKDALDKMVKDTKVYSRMEPIQKLDIVNSLIRNGEFVAVTGDGVNDAPALKNSNVGIAMGKSGTDIARESADMVLMDDNFLSITNAVEEGRVVYNNIRKVVFFAVSCGLPKVIIYILSIICNLPMPFTATQLLWLNVMTEGVQNISLAFESAEGNEMTKKPRDPKEPIFNSTMIFRIALSMLVVTVLCFGVFFYSIKFLGNDVKTASSMILMLFVFIQNMQVLNSRSESTSIFKQSLLKNKILIVGITTAVLIHILASNSSFISGVLKITPLPLKTILTMFLLATLIILTSELEKLTRKVNKSIK